MPENTKELLENILKQQDKKVLERLHSWGIKSNKNIEAKIIFMVLLVLEKLCQL